MEIEKLKHLDDLGDIHEGDLFARIPMALVEVAEIIPNAHSCQWGYADGDVDGNFSSMDRLEQEKFLVYSYGLAFRDGSANLIYATHLREDTNLPNKLFSIKVQDLRDYKAINPRKALRPA